MFALINADYFSFHSPGFCQAVKSTVLCFSRTKALGDSALAVVVDKQ